MTDLLPQFAGVQSFDQWRLAARPMLSVEGRPPRISPGMMKLLETLSMWRDDGRWELMYRLAWRVTRENRELLEDAADPDVRRARLIEHAIHRDVHKMHAFVRFREVIGDSGDKNYVAWFEPEHRILKRGAVFFVERFPNMHWTIATPDGTAVWDMRELRFIDSPATGPVAAADAFEDMWRTYYRSICNVSRINPAAMRREMPQRYWKNLPEAAEIASLLREGAAEFAANHKQSTGGLPMARAAKRSLPNPDASEGPETCRRCDLWKQATQAVPGEGPAKASIMLVGEQPGDEEDLRGHAFVGPAGKVLDEMLAEAGVDRSHVFVTNAVKHFKWEPRGKRRLHKKPGTEEINACNVWLQREIERISPRVIVALGATALRALTGATLTIDAARRQELVHPGGARILATYHPSAILRAEGERVTELRTHLRDDLQQARDIVGRDGGAG